MAYTQHNFRSGMKLTGQDMAELDAQIAANEADIRTLETGVAAVPAQRKADIRRLSLEADSDSIYLYFGNELLGSVSMPDTESIIRCTGLTATANLSNLMLGDTASITATRQPSNCNQSVRYKSTDTSVVTVTSAGVVTAVGSGSASIEVRCGSELVTLNAKVSRTVSLVGKVTKDIGNLSVGSYRDVMSCYFVTDGSNNWVGNLPYDLDAFRVRPGEALRLSVSDTNYPLAFIKIFREAENAATPLHVLDLMEDDDRYALQPVASVEAVTEQTDYTYSNTNAYDVYFAFVIRKRGQSSGDIIPDLADIDSYVTVQIGPASGN